jgi:hypothetical protein
MTNEPHIGYDVLSPWAEADPIAFRGMVPRLDTLDGKRIGLLVNSKRAAAPTLRAVERRLKEKFPTVTFTNFANLTPNETVTETAVKEQFEDWVKEVDAVIAAFGD